MTGRSPAQVGDGTTELDEAQRHLPTARLLLTTVGESSICDNVEWRRGAQTVIESVDLRIDIRLCELLMCMVLCCRRICEQQRQTSMLVTEQQLVTCLLL